MDRNEFQMVLTILVVLPLACIVVSKMLAVFTKWVEKASTFVNEVTVALAVIAFVVLLCSPMIMGKANVTAGTESLVGTISALIDTVKNSF